MCRLSANLTKWAGWRKLFAHIRKSNKNKTGRLNVETQNQRQYIKLPRPVPLLLFSILLSTIFQPFPNNGLSIFK